ncbi:hypothetical protein HS125_12820 [bacterium]|nr:hypothetical protein [bacterium]
MQNPMREFVAGAGRSSFPARDLIDNRRYIRPDLGVLQTTLVTERGCPYQCIYCLAPVFGTRVRKRSRKTSSPKSGSAWRSTHPRLSLSLRSFTADRVGSKTLRRAG